MSTLTQGRPAFGGFLLLFLLLIVVLASLPPAPGPGSGSDPAPSASSGAPQPPFPDWRMGGERNYKNCPGKAIQHILCRHGAASKQPGGKFYTNSAREVRGMIKTAMKHGERVWDADGGVWKVTYKFGEKIGHNKFGRVSKKIEILLSEAGDILTAYPF